MAVDIEIQKLYVTLLRVYPLNKIALLNAISRATGTTMNAKIIRLPAPRRKISEKESEVLAEIKALRAKMRLLKKLIAKAIQPSPFDYEDEPRV